MKQVFSLALLAAATNAARASYYSQPSYGGHSHHNHSSYQTVGYKKDPWVARQNDITNDRQSWYSPYQQFAPAVKKFEPTATHDIFARCDFNSFGNSNGNAYIQFYQTSGKAPTYQIQITDSTSNNSSERWFGLRIMEYGDTSDAPTCPATDTGEEYNPLKEVDKHGRANPYQDPYYGRLMDFNIASSENSFAQTAPTSLLQNLEGKYSIMGRSVIMITVNADGTEPDPYSIKDCCTILYEAMPSTYAPQISYIEGAASGAFTGYARGYGGYGGAYGHGGYGGAYRRPYSGYGYGGYGY